MSGIRAAAAAKEEEEDVVINQIPVPWKPSGQRYAGDRYRSLLYFCVELEIKKF